MQLLLDFITSDACAETEDEKVAFGSGLRQSDDTVNKLSDETSPCYVIGLAVTVHNYILLLGLAQPMTP